MQSLDVAKRTQLLKEACGHFPLVLQQLIYDYDCFALVPTFTYQLPKETTLVGIIDRDVYYTCYGILYCNEQATGVVVRGPASITKIKDHWLLIHCVGSIRVWNKETKEMRELEGLQPEAYMGKVYVIRQKELWDYYAFWEYDIDTDECHSIYAEADSVMRIGECLNVVYGSQVCLFGVSIWYRWTSALYCWQYRTIFICCLEDREPELYMESNIIRVNSHRCIFAWEHLMFIECNKACYIIDLNTDMVTRLDMQQDFYVSQNALYTFDNNTIYAYE